jgi:DNA helicase-2/ATP-dependent DNA helicase PcrA
MEDGVFPHYRSMTDRAELEEERRLAYVGITRARQRLYLTHAWSRTLFGQTSYNPASRFLGEIPEYLLDQRESGGGRSRKVRDSRGKAYDVIGLPGRAAVAEREPASVAPGDTVVHDRFGEGVVLAVSGTGSDVEARVAFSDVGEKNLLLAYAPLRKVGA